MKNNISECLNNTITNVYIEPIEIKEKFINFAHRFADIYGTCVLISGGKNSDCARYNMLGIKPWFEFKSKGKKIKISINQKKKK